MDLALSLKLAWRALARNPMRASLTMLGVVIGVAAVVATLAIGQGARSSVQAQIASLGSNVIMLFPGTGPGAGGSRGAQGSSSTMTVEDCEAIARECPSVDRVAWSVRAGGQVIYGANNWQTGLVGTTEDFFAIREWPVEQGTSFTDADVRNSARVAVLGATVAENLFGTDSPVGQMIRIRNLPFRVVGVLVRKGSSAMGSDQDDTIILPGTTVQKKFLSSNNINFVYVSAKSAGEINSAVDEITGLLRQRHRIRTGQDDDFFVRNQAEFASAAEATSKTMTLLLSSIAAVSLLVGGIGIMNIMLVSVTERTREIGIRMAIGARGSDVLTQFLVESVVMSLLGGVIGLVVGVGGSMLLGRLTGWATAVPTYALFIAVGFSAAVGVFFGFYPARKAAALNPIQALRYE